VVTDHTNGDERFLSPYRSFNPGYVLSKNSTSIVGVFKKNET
jgi:hypothetical protein